MTKKVRDLEEGDRLKLNNTTVPIGTMSALGEIRRNGTRQMLYTVYAADGDVLCTAGGEELVRIMGS